MSAIVVKDQRHASAVAFGTKGCLITGNAGSGKSSLALELIALGAELVADDRTDLRSGEHVTMSCPPETSGLIEARGVGLIRMAKSRQAIVSLWVDLDEINTQRLPPRQNRDLLGIPVPVIFGPYRPGLAAIVKVLLTGGSLADPDEPVAP